MGWYNRKQREENAAALGSVGSLPFKPYSALSFQTKVHPNESMQAAGRKEGKQASRQGLVWKKSEDPSTCSGAAGSTTHRQQNHRIRRSVHVRLRFDRSTDAVWRRQQAKQANLFWEIEGPPPNQIWELYSCTSGTMLPQPMAHFLFRYSGSGKPFI